MNKMEFMQSLHSLGKYYDRPYDEEFKQACCIDILKRMRPDAEEWLEAIQWLRSNEDYPPRISKMKEALMKVRRAADMSKQKRRMKVPCERCLTIGYLYHEEETQRYVLGCGCGNTPENFPEERCLKHLLELNLVEQENIRDITGRPILLDKKEWKRRSWQTVVDLYLADKWVPKWIKERFDAGNFDRPRFDEYPKRKEGQTEEEFKDEKIGEIPF
jgi:glutaredoxin 2